MQFLTTLTHTLTLQELNERLWKWNDKDYHLRVHVSTKQKLLDRYLERIKLIRPAPKNLFDYFRIKTTPNPEYKSGKLFEDKEKPMLNYKNSFGFERKPFGQGIGVQQKLQPEKSGQYPSSVKHIFYVSRCSHRSICSTSLSSTLNRQCQLYCDGKYLEFSTVEDQLEEIANNYLSM